MEEDKKFALHENFLLFLLVAVGVLLIISGQLLPHGMPHELVTTLSGLGEAFFIAGALGFIVDKGLKKALAKDAISFWVGWEVTPALREAVKEIIRLPCVRHDFTVHYTIERCENPKGFVRLSSVTRFCVENMTAKSQTYEFQSRVEPSKFDAVTAAGLKNATLEMSLSDSQNGTYRNVMVEPKEIAGVLVRALPVKLAGRDKQWFHTRREQYFPENFFAVLDFLAPACEGATVKVTPNPAFKIQVRFGANPDPGPEAGNSLDSNEWVHKGVLLPGQHVRIQWTPRP